MDEIFHQENHSVPVYSNDIRPSKKNHRFLGGFIVGFILSLILCVIVIAIIVSKTSMAKLFTTTDMSSTEEKLESLYSFVDQYYLEDVDEDAWADGAYHGAIKSLDDPYSEFYTAEEFEELQQSLTANYAGIGALLQKDTTTGAVTITRVYPNSPAEKAGLQKDDIIAYADEYSCMDESLDTFVQHIRGDAGTDVELTVIRDLETIKVTVTRDNVDIPTVEYEMLPDNNGYIMMSQFGTKTGQDFIAACDDLIAQGADSLIIDLRDNGGGLVDASVEALDYLLPEGIVVYSEDKYGTRQDYTSDAEHKVDLPIVILVNGNTASASEIFAGAIRDYEYGTLIGTKTFGKGIMQSTVQFADGTAIKLTTNYYYTPSGECIHKTGINPDIELEYERPEGEYSKETDNQLIYAQEYLENQN
ncbi:MAG: S41 family peptidase [Pseudobutyrivibrio sp.]|nr:S41 family peptidase [Pseudobutyrivibrio sp.]